MANTRRLTRRLYSARCVPDTAAFRWLAHSLLLLCDDHLLTGTFSFALRVQLRNMKTGTRISLCSLLVYIEFGEAQNLWAKEDVLRELLERQQACHETSQSNRFVLSVGFCRRKCCGEFVCTPDLYAPLHNRRRLLSRGSMKSKKYRFEISASALKTLKLLCRRRGRCSPPSLSVNLAPQCPLARHRHWSHGSSEHLMVGAPRHGHCAQLARNLRTVGWCQLRPRHEVCAQRRTQFNLSRRSKRRLQVQRIQALRRKQMVVPAGHQSRM
jgi:hypothetical protein